MCHTGQVDEQKDLPKAESDAVLLQVRPLYQNLLIAVVSALGIGLGIAAPAIIRWAHGMEWLPFDGPMRLLELLASKIGSWILPVIGAIAGFLVGGGIVDGMAKVRVSARDVTVIHGKKKQRFARAQVTAALVDEGHLVLRDERDADLIRTDVDIPINELVATLRHYDWPVEK